MYLANGCYVADAGVHVEKVQVGVVSRRGRDRERVLLI